MNSDKSLSDCDVGKDLYLVKGILFFKNVIFWWFAINTFIYVSTNIEYYVPDAISSSR